jgi:outer membrane protein assembly factor BamA
VDLDERRYAEGTGIPNRRRNSVRAGWSVSSSRQFGYSISPEDGMAVRLNVEQVEPALGADGAAFTVTADGRAYMPGLGSNHVVAVRAALADSRGDAAMQRTFNLGGSGVAFRAFDMGSQSIGLLRGLPSDERAGAAVFVANLDYRCPIVRVERGIRTWPVFLRDAHGALFVDVGSAGDGLDALPAAALSAGAELGTRLTLGYSWDVSLVAGAAWTHDPTRPDRPDRFAAYVRTGFAF